MDMDVASCHIYTSANQPALTGILADMRAPSTEIDPCPGKCSEKGATSVTIRTETRYANENRYGTEPR